LEEALESIDKALAIKADNALALNNRGLVLRELKRFAEALESIDKALTIKPDLSAAAINRELALLGLRRLTRYPLLAARAMFDEFSPHYDKTMLERLGYRAHIHVRTLADRALPRLSAPLRILDLGAGTGLVGDAFRDLAVGGRLDGIDLAPRMIEAARARGIYDDLILGDLEAVLAERGPAYDLIVSADTMIYLGDLAPTFSGVVQRLVRGGFYIFACESKQGEGWEQTPENRFRHSQVYMRTEATRAGLEFADIMECFLRHQAGEPVPGFAVALKKPEGITPPISLSAAR
jgi:predicted TPR repeat methyltransferase